MARPTQITLAAAIILLVGGLAVVAAAFLWTIPTEDRAASLMVFATGAWGLATGVGLLRLQSWARQSVLVSAGLAAYLAAIFAPLMVSFRIPLEAGIPQLTAAQRILTVAVFLLSGVVASGALVPLPRSPPRNCSVSLLLECLSALLSSHGTW